METNRSGHFVDSRHLCGPFQPEIQTGELVTEGIFLTEGTSFPVISGADVPAKTTVSDSGW